MVFKASIHLLSMSYSRSLFGFGDLLIDLSDLKSPATPYVKITLHPLHLNFVLTIFLKYFHELNSLTHTLTPLKKTKTKKENTECSVQSPQQVQGPLSSERQR